MGIGGFLSFFPLSFAALWDFRHRIIPDWTVFLIFSCAALNFAIGQTALLPCAIGMHNQQYSYGSKIGRASCRERV